MLPSAPPRRLLVGAMSLLAISSQAVAQQSLPTIEVGGARRGPATRSPNSRTATQGGAPTGQPTTAPAEAVASRFPSEPKIPERGYVVRDATTGMKLDIPIRETPASIAVVPRQVMRDQNITRLNEALENVSGVQSNNNDLEGYNFIIRGFRSLYIYRNALAIPAGEANPQIFDTANIERIEVLKGPASILYGRSEPGGLISIITKQPLDQPRYVVEQQIGSYDHYRTQWDFSTPSKEVPGLAARLSGAYQNSGSFRKFQGGNRVIVAPVVSYRPTDWTELTLDTQFMSNRAQSDIGQPPLGPYGNLPWPLPNNRSFQEPNDPRDRNDSYNISYNFRQNLNEDWKITNRVLYTETWLGKPMISALAVEPDNVTLDRVSQYQDLHGRTYSTNIDVNGKFETFGAKHNFLFGLDYLNSVFNYYFGNGFDLYPINIYAPIYGTVPTFAYWDAIAGRGFKYHSSNVARQKGMYAQDYVTLAERLHLLFGARYDVADVTRGTSASNYDTGEFADVLAPNQNAAIAARLAAPTHVFTGWTPRAGVVFDITAEVSAYGSYSRSFGTSNGFTAQNRALPPEMGQQWEVGLKGSVLKDVSATLAFFQITKSNVATQDFLNLGAVQLAGLQRSRGVELDVIGRATDRLAIVANYAHIDAKVIDDAPVNRLNPFGMLDVAFFGPRSGLFGNHLPNVPQNSGKISLVYDFGDNGVGLRVGGGVTAQSQSWGDIQNTFVLPGWARLDAFASYATLVEGHRLTAQLNLRNINNAHYFNAVDSFFNFNIPPYQRIPAQPFTAVGTLRFEW
jgi:iron complex outermembrane receptor protein